jgi:hypothetical protein
VNIIHCRSSSTASGGPFACFVIDAGPNGVIDTSHDLARSSTVTAQVDDIIYRIK